MPLLLALIAATDVIVLIRSQGRFSFVAGRNYLICLPPGADPAILGLNFGSGVSDAGGGCYRATAPGTFTTSMPLGTRVSDLSAVG